ncbi:MAG: hypothetical protein AAFY65_01275 [Pseudomonadota bacterium]
MGLIKVQPFQTGAKASGLSISQGESRGQTYFRIGLSEAAQVACFGKAVDPQGEGLAFTLTDDPKLLHLMGLRIVPTSDPSCVPVTPGVKGSVGAKVQPWRPANGKRPPASLSIVNLQVEGGGVSVKLPDWARPVADHAAAAKSKGRGSV